MTTETDDTLEQDVLEGAAAIAKYLFGKPQERRKVYRVVESGELPIFRMGDKIYARKSTLLDWIKAQEARAMPAINT